MKKMAVIYYSWSNGNTKRIAEMLEKAGADIAEIDTVLPYEGSYDDVVNQGQEEVNSGFKPKIKDIDIDISNYDVIAIGTPTWWYTMAPAVHTFIDEHDFSGKSVIPFITNGGWPGHAINDMKNGCVGADIKYPMEIKFDSEGGPNLETKQEVIDKWIENIVEFLKK